jgi:hypothetical protein
MYLAATMNDDDEEVLVVGIALSMAEMLLL